MFFCFSGSLHILSCLQPPVYPNWCLEPATLFPSSSALISVSIWFQLLVKKKKKKLLWLQCVWWGFYRDRELCAELSGNPAKISGVCDAGVDPAVRQDHQTGLVRLSERWLRVPKRHCRCHALPPGVCERALKPWGHIAVSTSVYLFIWCVHRIVLNIASLGSPSCPSWPMRSIRFDVTHCVRLGVCVINI